MTLIFDARVPRTACHRLKFALAAGARCHVTRRPPATQSVGKDELAQALDADQVLVELVSGVHRVNRQQLLTRRQALLVDVLRVEFDLDRLVDAVQVQLQAVQRVPDITQHHQRIYLYFFFTFSAWRRDAR